MRFSSRREQRPPESPRSSKTCRPTGSSTTTRSPDAHDRPRSAWRTGRLLRAGSAPPAARPTGPEATARSLVQRQSRPVDGLYSCSCQPSPKPNTARPAGCASNCSIATSIAVGADGQPRVVAGARQGSRQRDHQSGRTRRHRHLVDRRDRRRQRALSPVRRPGACVRRSSASTARLCAESSPRSAAAWPAPVLAGDAGRLRGQRPALAEIPGRAAG